MWPWGEVVESVGGRPRGRWVRRGEVRGRGAGVGGDWGGGCCWGWGEGEEGVSIFWLVVGGGDVGEVSGWRRGIC